WKSRSSLLTFCPSVKATRNSGPEICDRTCTIAEASTEPTTRSSVGTDSCTALATDTGTMGGPMGPLACVGWVFWHAVSSTNKRVGMRRDRTGTMRYSFAEGFRFVFDFTKSKRKSLTCQVELQTWKVE